MKIHYNAPRGRRMRKQFRFLCCDDYWFVGHYANGYWTDNFPQQVQSYANFSVCYSLKAAMRQVRRAQVPKGTRFYLQNQYGIKGNNSFYDIEITK